MPPTAKKSTSAELVLQDLPTAMVCPDGTFRYPDNEKVAKRFAIEFEAIPANPDAWPWPGWDEELPADVRANAMIVPDGTFRYPDDIETARELHSRQGAMPVNPARWPWQEQLTEFFPAARGDDFGDAHAEAGTDQCFPNGIDPRWSNVTCSHGSFNLS